REAEMEQRFSHLIGQMEQKVSAQFAKEAVDERFRTSRQNQMQANIAAGFQCQFEQFNNASSDQIRAISEVSTKQQGEMAQAFESALGGLQTLISSQSAAATEREAVIESRFNSQLERLAAEQQQLLAVVTQGA